MDKNLISALIADRWQADNDESAYFASIVESAVEDSAIITEDSEWY
jgi:hypothetical protein